MDKTKIEMRVELEPTAVWVKRGDSLFVWNPDDTIESHDPMDRVGGPYKIHDFVNPEDCGERFFIFAVVDCYFPLRDLVRADSFEEAYEIYVDFAAEKRHCAIDEADLGDYCDEGTKYGDDNDNFRGDFTSNGVPVDTENIQGSEYCLVRVDGKYAEKFE